MILGHLNELATRAHYGTSFSPEKRGRQYVTDYSAELESDLQQIRDAAATHGKESDDVCQRYKERYEKHFTTWLHAKTNCISSMITGPSNFPVRRAEKYNNREHNHHSFFRQWRERALAAIIKGFRPKETPLTELERATQDLQQCEANHERMKKANALIRKEKDPEALKAGLRNIGFTDKIIQELLSPRFGRGQGYEGWALANNNANIRRLRDRVTMLQSKAEKHAAGEKNEVAFMDVKILENFEADRLQLFFPGKPEPQIITTLKKSGWKWSPSNKCWQRKLTNEARFNVKHCILPAYQEHHQVALTNHE
jgi:hypothetical protein